MKINIRKAMRGIWICLILGTIAGGMMSCSKEEIEEQAEGCYVITGWSTVDDGGEQENYFLFLDNGGRQLVDKTVWEMAFNGEITLMCIEKQVNN